jgi:hypothetical protein
VARLLGSLRAVGAEEQAAALLARDPAARAVLNDSRWHSLGMASLLGQLREAGAHEQAAVLASRLPRTGMFGLFLEQQGGRDRFWFGRETDGSPSGAWDWDDLD